MKKYKKQIVIVVLLAIANLLAFTRVHAQNRIALMDSTSKPLTFTQLLADETTISYLKNDAKIECDNEEIAQKLLRRYDQIIKRCSWGYKKDRYGTYKHYLIVVSKEDANLIVEWAKTNL